MRRSPPVRSVGPFMFAVGLAVGLGGSVGNGRSAAAASKVAYTVLEAFGAAADDGLEPAAGLAYARGHLYGVTRAGGSFGRGAVIEISPGQSASGTTARTRTIYSFGGAGDGAGPDGTLLAAETGELFGTTARGGRGFGTVFRLAQPVAGGVEWTKTELYAFAGGPDGALPVGGLAGDHDGNLYGVTAEGGTASCRCGTVFRIGPFQRHGPTSWTKETLHWFSGPDGATPGIGLAFRDGAVFGATQAGGGYGRGVVYRLAPRGGTRQGWSVTVLHDFTGRADGGNPAASPIFDAEGTLYGTTRGGGDPSCGGDPGGCGVVYSLARTSTSGEGWSATTLYAFTGREDGAHPGSALAFGPFGTLYGTTEGDGPGSLGSIFALSPSGALGAYWSQRTLHTFNGGADGGATRAPLLRIGGGLYGTSPSGGAWGGGVVFALRPY